MPNTERVLMAIREVADVIRGSRSVGGRVQIVACEEVAQVVQKFGDAVACRLNAKLSLLSRYDPLSLNWNPLRMLDRQYDEPAWTRWLGNLVRLPRGGAIAWSCLCNVVADSMAAQPAEQDNGFATSADWRAAANIPLRPEAILTERPTGDGGFMDITVESAKLLVVVENKLWGGWHDRPGRPQAISYKQWARRVASDRQRVGLVYLSVYEVDERDRRRDWVFITWASLAQALRGALRRESEEASAGIGLAPLYLTIAAIEQDLLGFRLDVLAEDFAGGRHWRRLDILARITRHLEESHGED
jgi:hypothetical protein